MQAKERARIIIIKQGRLLTLQRTKAQGVYWVFPGGGVDEPETVEEALVREGKEELGVEVVPLRILVSLPCGKKELLGEMEHFYICDIKSGVLGTGDGEEFRSQSGHYGKYDLAWIPLDTLAEFDLRPHTVRDLLINEARKKLK